jgi:signal transduction histidine kinase/CheY-like chemotaxis protein
MLKALRGSVRRKVILLVLAATVSALAIAALALVVYDLRTYELQWSNDLNTQAEILARASAPALSFNDRKTATTDLTLMKVRPRVLAAALYTRDGDLFATYAKPGLEMVPFPPHPQADGYRVEGDQLLIFRRVVEGGDTIGTVYLRALYLPWDRVRDYLTILGVVMLASLAVAALISGWLQKVVTVPILEVARVAREVMAQRDYSLRARKISDDEIGELVDSFNALLAETGRRAEALREADRRKDEFLATLAHELRNPLAPLRNALEILRLAESNPAMTKKAREMMERQLNQMVRLVDDLLDVSRITTGKLAIRKIPIELQAVVRDAVETVRPFIEARGHRLEVTMPPEPIIVEGDRTRLGQVVGNLLNNAAKYTESGGHIALTLEREGHAAALRVRDSGIGLEPQSLSSIFDMFMQVDRSLERAQAGLGVGLTLAKRLVFLHGGTLVAKSEGKGKGSEFEVRLPLAGAVLEEPDRGDASKPAPVQSRRILLADDNVDFATSLAALLTARGHEVRIAHDGAEALATAERFHPDFAFLDLGMPKVHGYEVARRLRDSPGTTQCVLVAVTGWGQEDDRQRAREAGFDRHVVKPVDPSDIETILASY